jgi:hypothetical protein
MGEVEVERHAATGLGTKQLKVADPLEVTKPTPGEKYL